MGNRCSDCNKFVSLEQGEPEVNLDLDVEQGFINGDCRLVLNCAECGTELKEATVDINETVDHTCDGLEKGEKPSYFLMDSPSEPTDRFQGTDESTPSRYQKHYYGANITCSIKCGVCGEEFEQEITVEEQASAFEDLN